MQETSTVNLRTIGTQSTVSTLRARVTVRFAVNTRHAYFGKMLLLLSRPLEWFIALATHPYIRRFVRPTGRDRDWETYL